MQYRTPENIILISPTLTMAEPLAQQITELASIKLSGVWGLPLSEAQTIDPTNTFIIFTGQPQYYIEMQQLAQQIPSLWLTEHTEELSTIRNVLSLGFVSHIESTNISSLRAVIKQGALHFQTQYELRAEIKNLNTRLDERKKIEIAKGLLMQKHQYNESEAYAFIRKLSMDRAQKMGIVAQDLLCETSKAP